MACLLSVTLLLLSFARHGSYCRSRLKKEVYIFGLFVVARLFWLTLLPLSPTLSLQTGPKIVNFFRSTRVILSLTLKERGIHICLVCCRSRFRSKRVTLSLTLKGIHACLVSFSWQMPFSDRIPTENCAYDSYKPSNHCVPFA